MPLTPGPRAANREDELHSIHDVPEQLFNAVDCYQEYCLDVSPEDSGAVTLISAASASSAGSASGTTRRNGRCSSRSTASGIRPRPEVETIFGATGRKGCDEKSEASQKGLFSADDGDEIWSCPAPGK